MSHIVLHMNHRTHGEIDGYHETDLTASTDVVSECVQRNCPARHTLHDDNMNYVYTHTLLQVL